MPGGCAGPKPAPPRAQPSEPGPPGPACVRSPTTGCTRGSPPTPPTATIRKIQPPAAPAATSAAAGSPGASAPAPPIARTQSRSAPATTAPCRPRTGTRCRASRRTGSAGAGRARRTARPATPSPERRQTLRRRWRQPKPPKRSSVSGDGAPRSGDGAGSLPPTRLAEGSGRRSRDAGGPGAPRSRGISARAQRCHRLHDAEVERHHRLSPAHTPRPAHAEAGSPLLPWARPRVNRVPTMAGRPRRRRTHLPQGPRPARADVEDAVAIPTQRARISLGHARNMHVVAPIQAVAMHHRTLAAQQGARRSRRAAAGPWRRRDVRSAGPRFLAPGARAALRQTIHFGLPIP